MSDTKKARYVGGLDAVTLTVPVSTEGEPPRHLTVQHGGELPTSIDGHKVPASFRDSLLEQSDNWTEVNRSDKATAAKADEKEA
jgi:hypothetical protein